MLNKPLLLKSFPSTAILTILIIVTLTALLPKSEADSPVSKTTTGLVPLEISVGEIRFIEPCCVPQNIPNLEPRSHERRPDFMVPKGTVNVALFKKVTSSCRQPLIGDLYMITDGLRQIPSTANELTLVDLGWLPQWITIDLQSEYDLQAIVMWNYHKIGGVYKDIIVQVSNDPEFNTDVITLFNNDHDNSSGIGPGTDKNYHESPEGRLFDARGRKARYIRIHSAGTINRNYVHFVEVEVYAVDHNYKRAKIPPRDRNDRVFYTILPGTFVDRINCVSTHQNLIDCYGAKNVTKADIDKGEGDYEPGTILYANDPDKKFEILWWDKDNLARPQQIIITGNNSKWHLFNGITLGTALKEIQRLNGKPFELAGFGFDYSGTITSWNDGALDTYFAPPGNPKNLKATLRLAKYDSGKISSQQENSITGDHIFPSNDPVMQKLNPQVSQIIIRFPDRTQYKTEKK